jgi:hypothetical protein
MPTTAFDLHRNLLGWKREVEAPLAVRREQELALRTQALHSAM